MWQRTPDNRGTETLQQILVDELSLPVDHLRSEPVCAAAYFAYRYQQVERRPIKGNLLVCDMGGGTFDVALCRVSGQHVEVLDFEGNGHQGLGLAGVVFDRAAVTLAYAAVHGENPAPDNLEFLDALREFEKVKIGQHHSVISLLELRSENLELSDTPLYVFQRKYQLKYDQVQESFQPIEEGIATVLSRLLERAKAKGWTVDRVAIVGGFGQFPFVQQTILKRLGIGDQDVRFDATIMNSEVRAYAVAYGSALIANEIIQPVEYYPHTIGIFAYRKEKGVLVEAFLPLIEAGKMPAGQATPYFMQDNVGKPLTIRVERQAYARLPVYICLRGAGELFAIQTPEVEYPPAGSYHLGLIVDRSNLASLIFKPLEAGEERVYHLGKLSFDLMVEEE